jgi:hypothetical protein
MSNKSLTIGLLITLVIAVCAIFVSFSHNVKLAGSVAPGVDISTTNFTSISSSNGIANGGVYTTAARTSSMTAATTTVCAIQGPNATTSIVNASALFTVSSTTASTVTIGAASTAYATTTFLASGSIAANAQGTIYASATSSTNFVLAPNGYVVVGMAGGTGTFSPTGVCTATFQVLQ